MIGLFTALQREMQERQDDFRNFYEWMIKRL